MKTKLLQCYCPWIYYADGAAIQGFWTAVRHSNVSVNVGNCGSCITVATRSPLAQLPGEKAMMPARATPVLFVPVPLLTIAGRVITRSWRNPG